MAARKKQKPVATPKTSKTNNPKHNPALRYGKEQLLLDVKDFLDSCALCDETEFDESWLSATIESAGGDGFDYCELEAFLAERWQVDDVDISAVCPNQQDAMIMPLQALFIHLYAKFAGGKH